VVDCIIVGSGLAGLTAALTLYDLGATVVVVEKEGYLGGNSVKVCVCLPVQQLL
jgi:heterodisulfide reductase subunit A-like polyferredoxin